MFGIWQFNLWQKLVDKTLLYFTQNFHGVRNVFKLFSSVSEISPTI